MKAQVSPIRGDLPGMVRNQVVDAKGGVMPAEKSESLFAEPGLVPELDRPLEPLWRRFQKRRQALQVRLPPRWKLDQNGAQMVLQSFRAADESLQRLDRILQLLHMRRIAAEFERVEESVRRPIPPRLERRFRWQAVKAVIDLYGIEPLRIEVKPPPHRNLARIEQPFPVLVLIA